MTDPTQWQEIHDRLTESMTKTENHDTIATFGTLARFLHIMGRNGKATAPVSRLSTS